jgi:hypothetical protein
VAWARRDDGTLLLATGSGDDTAAIWDPTTGTRLTTLTGLTEPVLSVAWARRDDGTHLLATACVDQTLIHQITYPAPPDTTSRPTATNPPDTTLTQATHTLIALGAAELWPPLSLIHDLVTITGAAPDPGTLIDSRLRVLVAHPGVGLLRGLGWPPAARAGFAALLAAELPGDPLFAAPPDSSAEDRERSLHAALDTPAAPPSRVPVDGVEQAADGVDAHLVALLRVLGPEAVAANPALPLRLRHRVCAMQPFGAEEARLLADVASASRDVTRADAGSATFSPGSAGISRHGNPNRLLPSQLALPDDLMTLARLRGDLLYRLHRGVPPARPQPVTLVLDVTPPVFGPIETVLKTIVHAATTELWRAGLKPTLVTLDRPGFAVLVAVPEDLALMWTSRTLEPPDLDTALKTAARATGSRTAVLTHPHLARDHPLVATPGMRVVTASLPGDDPLPPPAHNPYDLRVPPHPTARDIATAVRALLHPTSSSAAAPGSVSRGFLPERSAEPAAGTGPPPTAGSAP